MKRILTYFFMCLSTYQSHAQSFGNVYDENTPTVIDKVDWDLTNAQLINLRIELVDVNVSNNIKVNINDISGKVPMTLELDQTQSGNVIKGKLIVNKDTRVGVKTINVFINDTLLIKSSKNFLLYSSKVPSLAAPNAITPIVNNEAEVTLTIQNILNFRTLFIGDQHGNKSDLFDISILDTDYSNRRLKIRVFCPEASYVSPNYFVWLIDNNEPNNKFRTLRTDQLFSFSSTTRRFDQLEFYRGDKVEIIVPNKGHALSTQATYTIEGLNQSTIDLTFDGLKLKSNQKINIQNADEDCKIIENGSDGQRYRIKIKVKEMPKINEGNIRWSEENNTSLENGIYVNHATNKKFNVIFTGLGLDDVFTDLSKITFGGSANAIKFTRVSQQDGTFRGVLEVPKTTHPGRYVVKYDTDNRTFDLHTIVVHEQTTSNSDMEISAFFKNTKTFDFSNPKVFVERSDWNQSNRFISIKVGNNNDLGAQNVSLSITIKNDHGVTIAQYSKSHTVAEDETKIIPTDEGSYKWIDAAKGEIKEWYVYEVQVNWNGVSSNASSLSRSTTLVLRGNQRSFITPQLSIPFSQTVFIFEDSLKAAPYNIGLNLNIRYRSISDAFKVSPIYWGAGFYFSQNDLLDEQAMQFGTVAYIGVVYPPNASSNQFHISLGVGPNFNIKFKKDANKDDVMAAAMVLNIGYNFGAF